MRGVGLLSRLWRGRPERVSALDGYARWAPMYPAQVHNPLMEAEASVVGPIILAIAPCRALDVGTGTGRNLELLREAGASFVAGVDLSPSMLGRCADRFPRVQGDAQWLPFRSCSFDLVCSSLMCGDVPDLDAWVGEATRVLAGGGYLVYSDFHPSWSAAGWRRRFTGDDGRRYELPFFPHAIDEHLRVLERHGLAVRAIREPRTPGRTAPVVVVLHAVKPASSRA